MTALPKSMHLPQQRKDLFFFEACRRYLRAGGEPHYACDILARAIREISVEDAAAKVHVRIGQADAASASSSDHGGEGQGEVASNGHHSNALPVRGPTGGQLAAAKSVANVVALTVLDSYKIRDGRSIGDVRFGEVERLFGANRREAYVFEQIKKHIRHAGHDEKIRHLVKAKDMERFIQRAAEVCDGE